MVLFFPNRIGRLYSQAVGTSYNVVAYYSPVPSGVLLSVGPERTILCSSPNENPRLR